MITATCISAVFLLALAGQTPPDGPLESTGDPHVRPERVQLAPPRPLVAGGFTSIQVNTIGGLNVLGDAANEPAIGVDPTAPNRMVVGWRQFDTVASNFRQAGMAYTRDGGRSWSDITILEPGFFRSDPVLGVDAGGTFYYYSLDGNFDCQMFVSEDAGETWTDPIPAFGGDKQWFTVDRTGGLGDGNIYAAWSAIGCCGPNVFTKSIDGGFTYIQPVEIGNSPRWGTMDVDAEGRVYVVGRSFDASTIVVARSSDAQLDGTPTFDVLVEVPMAGGVLFQAGTPNPGGITGQLWIGVDRSEGPLDGNVYVMAPLGPQPGGDPMDVLFSRSEDGGQTWTEGSRVNDVQTGWQWFGSMGVAPNGRIDAVWNDTRNAPDQNPPTMSETYYAFSMDAGQTWSKSVPIGPQWNSYLGWPNQNKIGDYYGIISDDVGAHVIYATTYNGEQDVYYVRIGDYDCNDNGIGDVDDIIDGASADCNANGIPDECEIAAGMLEDQDGDGIPDDCGCLADVNGDGVLNILDFVAFQNAWTAQEPIGDCDANGLYNIIDFVCYQGVFVAGCE